MPGDKETPLDTAKDEEKKVQDQELVTDVEATPVEAVEEPSVEDEDTVEEKTYESEEQNVEEPPVIEQPAEEQSAAPAPVVVKRGGFVPTVLGGIVCVALGYGAANFVKPNGWPFPGANTEELTQELAVLKAQIADMDSAAKTQSASMTASQDELRTSLEAKIAGMDANAAVATLSDQLKAFEDRLTEIEARPVAEAIVSPEATAAYERQLAQMQDLLNSEIGRLEEAKDQAIAEETAAREATAKARLQTLVDAGEPFADALALVGGDIPPALKEAAQTGIPSVSGLQESYAEAARKALVAASRASYEAGEESWFQTVLRTQIGLRSTKPKEGDDADAILSRAEQSVRDGLFAEAIDTLNALPEAGRAEMQSWIADAQKRVDAMTALDEVLGQ
ncbi:COG4223 family protein [Celeribacter sp. ULVN23_4]